MPKAATKGKTKAATDAGNKPITESKKKSPSAKADGSAPKRPSAADLADISLEGEIDDTVPIYDTCDDLRKKLRVHLAQPGVTQAGFARELSELVRTEKVTAAHVSRFLTFKGPRAGGHSPVFYAGYVYFEKLRIRQGKKKSAKREQVEAAWEHEGGLPREGSHNIHAFCPAGQGWKFDTLGQFQTVGMPRGRGISRKKARA